MSVLASLEPGEHRLTCPDCGRSPKDRTFGVTVEDTGAAVGHCFRCEYVETHRPESGIQFHPGKAVSQPVAPLKRDTLSEYGLELFGACTGLPGTIGETPTYRRVPGRWRAWLLPNRAAEPHSKPFRAGET